MSSYAGFGKPKYGGGNFSKNFKLQSSKDGSGVSATYRILPPMKSCAETGEWAVYVSTHFGYKGVNQKDPSKPQHRTFGCVEDRDFQTKMIRQDCPECDLIAQRKAEKEALEAKAKAEGHTDDEIKEIVKPLSDWLFEHSCDRKWKMNVKSADGQFGTLALSHKTKKKLEAEILRLQTEDGIDALDLEQGVRFVFTRTGKGITVDDTVTVEYESIKENGRVVRVVKLAPLTEAEAAQALKECEDLKKSVRVLTYDQIKMLTQCSGEPEDVDAILALGAKREASPQPRTTSSSLPPATPPASRPAAAAPQTPVSKPAEQTPPPAPKSEPVAAAAPEASAAPGLDDEEAALMAQMAALRAKKAAAAAAAATPASAPAPAVAESKPVPATPAAAPAEGLPVDRAAFMARFKK